MKNNAFVIFMQLSTIAGVLAPVNAIANSPQAYPTNVSCELSLDVATSSDVTSIESVPRSCNEFRVQSELEFNLVKGACILGGTLSGLIYSFNDGLCHSQNAAALCRVQIQSTDIEEVTWYFEPNVPQNEKKSHEEDFRASCDGMGGKFEPLTFY